MSASRLTYRAAAAAAVLLAATGLAAPSASASTAAKAAYVRAAHLSPDTPKVDVYLNKFSGGTTQLWLAGVGYGDVGPYRRMAPGQYAVSMRPHGASPSTPAALSWTVTLDAGKSYTAAAIGERVKLHGIVLQDSLAAPKAKTGYVRVIQAASKAGRVTVDAAGAKVIASDTAFGVATGYVAVPAGRQTVQARSVSDPSVSGSVRLRIASRSINSVVLLDQRGGGIEVRPLVDAAGAATAPTGSVPAGGGGTAPRVGTDVPWLVGMAALLLLGAGLGVGRRSRTA